jgi:hypothetical protein
MLVSLFFAPKAMQQTRHRRRGSPERISPLVPELPAAYAISQGVNVPPFTFLRTGKDLAGGRTTGSEQTMANQRRPETGLEGITGAAQREGRKGPPPVHLWNPPFCGDLDMRIASDGTWYYLGTPIGRPALVRLFASVLKRENGKYFLVTPVEKVGIVVEDAPFLAVEMRAEGIASPVLNFRTNVDDWVACDADHALRFEPEAATGGLKPYLHVRRDLWAKVSRPLFYDLVARGEERPLNGQRMFGVASGSEFFVMAPADSLKDFA